MLNSRDINKLRTDVAANCRIFIDLCKQAGYPVLVTGTVRDDEYQLQCYKKGTGGKPPATFHSVKAGLAFDVCKNVKGQEYNDPAFWQGVGAIGRKMGFTWGGDWKRVDKPHFQWDEHGKYSGSHIKVGKYPPQMPLFEEEEDMTKEQTQAMIDEAMEAKKTAVWDELEEVPEWGRATVKKLMKLGILNGTGNGLGLNFDQLRILGLNDRAGLYGM
jgi:hypothetical protein